MVVVLGDMTTTSLTLDFVAPKCSKVAVVSSVGVRLVCPFSNLSTTMKASGSDDVHEIPERLDEKIPFRQALGLIETLLVGFFVVYLSPIPRQSADDDAESVLADFPPPGSNSPAIPAILQYPSANSHYPVRYRARISTPQALSRCDFDPSRPTQQ